MPWLYLGMCSPANPPTAITRWQHTACDGGWRRANDSPLLFVSDLMRLGVPVNASISFFNFQFFQFFAITCTIVPLGLVWNPKHFLLYPFLHLYLYFFTFSVFCPFSLLEDEGERTSAMRCVTCVTLARLLSVTLPRNDKIWIVWGQNEGQWNYHPAVCGLFCILFKTIFFVCFYVFFLFQAKMHLIRSMYQNWAVKSGERERERKNTAQISSCLLPHFDGAHSFVS